MQDLLEIVPRSAMPGKRRIIAELLTGSTTSKNRRVGTAVATSSTKAPDTPESLTAFNVQNQGGGLRIATHPRT